MCLRDVCADVHDGKPVRRSLRTRVKYLEETNQSNNNYAHGQLSDRTLKLETVLEALLKNLGKDVSMEHPIHGFGELTVVDKEGEER